MQFNVHDLKKYIGLVGVFFILFLLNPTLRASDLSLTEAERAWLRAHPRITMAIPINFPRSYYGVDGRLEGLGVDYLRLIEKKLGIHFEPKVSDWNTALGRAMDHEVDTILNAAKMKYREPYLNFTEVYFASPQTMVAPESESAISDLNEFCGRKIAVHKGSSRVKFLQQNYPCIELVEVTDKKDILPAIITQKADAGFDNYETIMGNLKELKLSGFKMIYFRYMPPMGFGRIGVRKDKPLLASILNKAVLSISDQEKTRIITKWLGVLPPPLPAELHGQTKPSLYLSPDEQKWIDEHPVIRVGADAEWRPIEFFENGRYKGFSISYLKRIETLLDIKFVFVQENWQALIARAKKQELDLFTCIATTPEREKYLLFTKPYIRIPAGVFTKKDVAYITDLNKIFGARVAVAEAYAIHYYLGANYPDVDLVVVKTPEEGIRKVVQGEAFAYIDNIITAGHLIRHKGYLDIKMAGELPFVYAQGMGVRKDWPQLRDILQKAIDAIPDSERNAIYNQWVPVIYERPADYSMFWKIGGGCLALICLIVFWNRRLKSEVAKTTAELASKEARLKAIFNHRFQLTGLLSPDGRLLMANENVCRFAGIGFKEIRGKYLWELPHWQHSETLKREIQDNVKRAQSGNQVNFETTHLDSEGRMRYIDFSLTPVRDEDGRIIYIVPEGHDYTKRKQAEESLGISEERLALAMDSVSDAVWDWNLQSNEVYFSPRWYTMLAYEPDELPQAFETWKRLLHPDDTKGAEENVLNSIDSGEPFETEFRMKTKDGQWKWILGRGKTVSWDDQGRPLRMVGTHFDLTERKRAEAELQESEERYRSIMASMDDATFICNPDFQILYMNPAMVMRCGGDRTGDACYKAIHGMSRPCPWCDIDPVIKGSPSKVEITSPLDGKEYNISSSPIHHVDGSVSKLSVLRDVTDIKQIERRLQQAQKMEAIGSLAGGIAHDFNNILFPIVGMSEMLIEDLADNSPEQRYAKQIFKAGQRAGDLVKQILAFSRQTDQKIMPIRIQPVLKEVLKLCRSSIPSDIEITEDIQKDCGIIEADSTQIHQVLMNLITNAYHAVGENGGAIFVRLREIELDQGDFLGSSIKPGRYAQFTVSDTGCGIAPDVMDKIFDPYFTTKEHGKGTGLGLATVYGIVREYQGDIKVYSELGTGTTFNVFLPLLEDADERQTAAKKERLKTGTERILLVDDEEPIVELERINLERMGYQVTGFTSSIDALNAFRSDPKAYDMVITDMTMPKMTGDHLSRELREIRPDIPILICTGFSERINRENIEAIGVDGVLMKPIVRLELSKTVRGILDKRMA